MDEVVSAYGKAVAVTRNLPHGHCRIGHLESRSHCGGTALDGVESVGVHVVREARAAPDARNHGCVVGSHAYFGHSLVEHVEYGMVATSGAPAHRLVALIVSCCIFYAIHSRNFLLFVHKFFNAVNDLLHQEGLTLNLIDALNLKSGKLALQIVGKLSRVQFGAYHLLVA